MSTDTPNTLGPNDDIAFVHLPGSDGWQAAYNCGKVLDERWPAQDAHNFAMALEYNFARAEMFPSRTPMVAFSMIREGANDGDNWVWVAAFADGTTQALEAGCDYTGWDCHSHAEWRDATAEELTTHDALMTVGYILQAAPSNTD